MAMLNVENLVTGYGQKRVVNAVTLEVAQGEIVALIGHNGAGKSTLIKALFGMIRTWEGAVYLEGELLQQPAPRLLLKRGVAYVPQGNRVFTELTVKENLEVAAITVLNKQRLKEGMDRIFALFPALEDHLNPRAGTLSGGEKQMLALSNALILSPRLVLLDEPSLGLAPPMVSQALHRIYQMSQNNDMAVLIVEQKVREVLKIANRVYVLRIGKVSFSGPASALQNDNRLREVYL